MLSDDIASARHQIDRLPSPADRTGNDTAVRATAVTMAVVATVLTGVACAVEASATPRSSTVLISAALVLTCVFPAAAFGLRGPVPMGIKLGSLALIGSVATWSMAAGYDGLTLLLDAAVPASTYAVTLSLPDGRWTTRGRRGAAMVSAALAVGLGFSLWQSGRAPSAALTMALTLVAIVAALPMVYARIKASRGEPRARLDITVAGADVALVVSAFAVWFALTTSFSAAGEVVALSAGCIPIALGLTAFEDVRRRSEPIIRHAIGLLALGSVLLAAQIVALLVASAARVGDHEPWLLAVLAGSLLAAVAFSPVRKQFVDIATRLVRGEQHRPEDVVRSFGAAAAGGSATADLLDELVHTLHHAMELRRSEIWVGHSDRVERVVSVPSQPALAVALQPEIATELVGAGVVDERWLRVWLPELLTARPPGVLVRSTAAAHAGEVLGLVVATRESDAEPFTAEHDRALADLGARLGVILRNRELDETLHATLDDLRRANDDLRASRARLVAAADAERNRIERDLHDGAQQHLVALSVGVRMARDAIGDDPETAATILGGLSDTIRETIQDLRRLAHGIYPPLLREAGLGEALRAAADRAPQRVRVDADTVGRHPPEVEAAVYFCCLEAMQNASKHAADATVDIILREDEKHLLFEITDDGPGFDVTAATGGNGLRNMADRLGAVGGSVSWESQVERGTRVVATVPLDRP